MFDPEDVGEDDDGPDHDDLLLRVAERYYFARQSRVTIAEEFGISRFRIARLLDEAERRGTVQITLHRPRYGRRDLSTRLKAQYDLRHAAVVESSHLTEAEMREALGREGARLLAGLLADGDVLGVGWGRSVEAVANAATALPRCPVVQMSGITGPPSSNSMELVRRFSAITGAQPYPLYAPLIAPDSATARALRRSHGIAETFEQFRDISVGLVTIGSWDPPNSLLHQFVSQDVREVLTAAGLQAEVGGLFLDKEGKEIATPLSGQLMSIPTEEFRAIPTVVAVAGHASKARAIRAVLRGGFANALVTDTAAAAALLEDP
ncbi:transcriptional regulator [Actinotalea sp. M2MS4P-6]|uniref:sugar-binding transcriptional regulator n=1 Tax=Actinotalea sp. M2MS4P-6 TaxID=2983762 RepID=UPI0021E4E80D|nr:sugar-binding domain-containing protein [Actinotalea sp. M2MS4P-6]MCV2395130.1 transcriptional regulator [Actinotalea sp. M2MS4P-6]